jgi:hypothetical protein
MSPSLTVTNGFKNARKMKGRIEWHLRASPKHFIFLFIICPTTLLSATSSVSVPQQISSPLRSVQEIGLRLAKIRVSGAGVIKTMTGTVMQAPKLVTKLCGIVSNNTAATNAGIISTTVGLFKVCFDEGLRRSIFFWTNAFPVYVHYRYYDAVSKGFFPCSKH